MKKLTYLLITLMIFSSCIEELEDKQRVFEKIYGFNGNSKAYGMIKSSDGSYIIYGSADKTILDMKQDYEGTQEKQIPIVIKIDQFGNEILSKSFPLSGIKATLDIMIQSLAERGLENGEVEIDYAYIEALAELTDGQFFAKFWSCDFQDYCYEGYFILDQFLNIQKIGLFQDNKIEFPTTYWVWRERYDPIVLSGSQKLFLLSPLGYFQDSITYSPYWNTFFYSLFEMDYEGTILSVNDFTDFSDPIVANDFVADNNGILTVLGESIFSGAKAYFHQIDLETGEVIKEVTVDNGSPGRKFGKIQSTENGFVTADPDITTHNGVLMKFYNHEFELVDTVFLEPSFNNACRISDFITTKDGGFCLLYWDCGGPMTVHKLDEKGTTLWKWHWKKEPGEGAVYTAKILETEEGGILYLGAKKFNSTGTKISLIKLDSFGNINWDRP